MDAVLLGRAKRIAAVWALGAIGLSGAAWACLALGLHFAAAAFVFLVAVICLALLDGLRSSLAFVAAAALCLLYFFIPPYRSFAAAAKEDMAALAAFVLASGLIVALVHRLRSLTDAHREQARMLAQAEAAYLAEAQRLSGAGSFGWNLDKNEFVWSDECARIFEAKQGPRPGIDFIAGRIHPDDAGAFQALVTKTRAERAPFEFETRLLLPGDKVKHVHVVARPLPDAPAQFVGALMDVTDRKAAADALRRSEYRYRNLFQAMAASFWELDFSGVGKIVGKVRAAGVKDLVAHFAAHPDLVREMMRETRVLDVNDETVSLFFGGDRGKVTGSVEPFWPEASNHVYAASVVAAITRKPSYAAECRLKTLDGREIDALFTACFAPETVAAGKLLIGVIDVTERVRAQAALERVRAEFAHAARVSMLGELTASIAHEVNQPLAAIAANAAAGQRWLDRPEPDLVEVRAVIDRIIADGARAGAIIARVRAMATQKPPEHGPLEINVAIGEALSFLRHELQTHGVEAVAELAPELPRVRADRTQIHQVVVNLVVNAMQAMAAAPAPRRIRVSSVRAGDGVEIAVEDSGPGISAAHKARLFESFFTTKPGGMGMGLPICRSIVEAHGGRIDVQDRPEGGARFRVTLPIAQRDAHT
ncbi:MAG: DUF4118 domain-containing protein [Hyphomonadaceae bacterium]|nr:DUF4118 domain-containing protein [Hyphomonadaceae bacterium]